jgi:hypothetical protein
VLGDVEEFEGGGHGRILGEEGGVVVGG